MLVRKQWTLAYVCLVAVFFSMIGATLIYAACAQKCKTNDEWSSFNTGIPSNGIAFEPYPKCHTNFDCVDNGATCRCDYVHYVTTNWRLAYNCIAPCPYPTCQTTSMYEVNCSQWGDILDEAPRTKCALDPEDPN
jgi:hypothetical protein